MFLIRLPGGEKTHEGRNREEEDGGSREDEEPEYVQCRWRRDVQSLQPKSFHTEGKEHVPASNAGYKIYLLVTASSFVWLFHFSNLETGQQPSGYSWSLWNNVYSPTGWWLLVWKWSQRDTRFCTEGLLRFALVFNILPAVCIEDKDLHVCSESIFKSEECDKKGVTLLLSMQTFSISFWHHAKCQVFADKSACFMQTTGNSRNLLANHKEGLGAAPSVTARTCSNHWWVGICVFFP